MMKTKTKRILLILLSAFFFLFLLIWLAACLFAAGQLYDTYNLWTYLTDAPVAVLIMLVLLAGTVLPVVAAVRIRDKITD